MRLHAAQRKLEEEVVLSNWNDGSKDKLFVVNASCCPRSPLKSNEDTSPLDWRRFEVYVVAAKTAELHNAHYERHFLEKLFHIQLNKIVITPWDRASEVLCCKWHQPTLQGYFSFIFVQELKCGGRMHQP